jgi:hypothetical protein
MTEAPSAVPGLRCGHPPLNIISKRVLYGRNTIAV